MKWQTKKAIFFFFLQFYKFFFKDEFGISLSYNAKKILEINKPKKSTLWDVFVRFKTQYSEWLPGIRISNPTVASPWRCSQPFPMMPSEQSSEYTFKTKEILEVKLS